MATMDEWNSFASKKQSFSSGKNVKRTSSINEGVDTYFETLLDRVLQAKQFGINLGSIELKGVTASCGDGKGDRFKISIPYANQRLDWRVMFNSSCPDEGPDFDFSDKTFLADPALQILEEFVPSLYQWNHLEPDQLLRVLTELVIHYKKHQIEQLDQCGERLTMEYTMLTTHTEICTEDIELILLPDSIQPEEAHFLIRLAMDFSKLPGRHTVVTNDAAMLLVTFQGANWNRITPHLYFSKNLEETLGAQNTQHLPAFPQDRSLMDYVPEIKKYINQRMNSIIINYQKKRGFINAVLCLQSKSVLEYDSVDFNDIAILLAHRDFHFIVHFNLSQSFPKDPPRITLESIYHMTSKTELFKQVLPNNYPYSPRWEPNHMLTKALTYIIEHEINKFRNNSMLKRR